VAASNKSQADQQEQDLQTRLARQYSALAGRSRVAGAARGFAGSATQAAIERNILLGASTESANAKINLALQKQAIDVNSTPQYIPEKSPFGGILSSLLAGASSGLDLAGSLQGLENATAMADVSNKASASQINFANAYQNNLFQPPQGVTY